MVPAPVILTSGPTRLRSVVCAWPLSILNDAESCDRSVAFSSLSCQPDSVPDVSERIICATLSPLIAPSWNTMNAVPVMFDMIARWLVPVERTLIFACILPSSLSKSATLRSSGNARTPVRSARIAKVGLAVDASMVRSPLALPS